MATITSGDRRGGGSGGGWQEVSTGLWRAKDGQDTDLGRYRARVEERSEERREIAKQRRMMRRALRSTKRRLRLT